MCMYNQNVKLVISALPMDSSLTYNDLMAKLVCSVDSNLCMIHRCSRCPGAYELRTCLEFLREVSDATDEAVHYKQWLTTDRTTLQNFSMPMHKFLETLVKKIETLTTHHYIAKHQLPYLSALKENLRPRETIIIMDFAGNYSFVVQNAAKGYLWNILQEGWTNTAHKYVCSERLYTPQQCTDFCTTFRAK